MKIHKDQHQNVINQYESGKSLNCIAKELEVSSSCVYYVLKKHKVKRRKRGAKKGVHNKALMKIEIEEIPNLIARYKNTNDTLADIASDYNVTKQAIDELLKRNNIERRERIYKSKISKQSDIDEIIQLYNSKTPYKDIAERFDCSPSLIRKVLISNGVKLKKSRKIKRTEHSSIIDRYKNGELMEDIAKDHDVIAGTIAAILKKHGVKTRRLKKYTPDIYAKVYDGMQNNLSYKSIAEDLGLKISTVAFMAKKKYEENN